jgi:hypothetical protein
MICSSVNRLFFIVQLLLLRSEVVGLYSILDEFAGFTPSATKLESSSLRSVIPFVAV